MEFKELTKNWKQKKTVNQSTPEKGKHVKFSSNSCKLQIKYSIAPVPICDRVSQHEICRSHVYKRWILVLVVWNIKYINITAFVFIFVIKHMNERFNEMEYLVTFENHMLF